MTHDLSPEVVEELVSFVRECTYPLSNAYEVHQRTKTLAAKLPPPVDPDIEEARKLLRAHPTILLPQQRCKIHGYRDPRERTADNSYLTEVRP